MLDARSLGGDGLAAQKKGKCEVSTSVDDERKRHAMSNYMDAIAEIRKDKAQWASRERGLSYDGKLRVARRMYELERKVRSEQTTSNP